MCQVNKLLNYLEMTLFSHLGSLFIPAVVGRILKIIPQDSCSLVMQLNTDLGIFANETEVPNQLILRYGDYMGRPDPTM